MKRTLFLAACLCCATCLQAQSLNAAWGSKDVRYAQDQVPAKTQKKAQLTGWKGEKVHTQAVAWTTSEVKDLNLELTTFTNGQKQTLPEGAVTAAFERYVMTDQLNLDGRGGCGARPDHSIYDSLMVADGIDPSIRQMDLSAGATQPVWVSCQIPADAKGTYTGKLLVKSGTRVLRELPLSIQVQNHTLPAPEDWTFHLDLWQNPYSVARYEQVPVWSEAHMEALRPIMTRLAQAGQKVITCSITHKPWNGQTEDPFESMVTWFKKLDGTWTFDYAVFDRWVEFMMSVGIQEQINCYSMVPWGLTFQYFDQRTNQMQEIQCSPGTPEYDDMWVAMLKDFSQHLRSKGWFQKCAIAMDERPNEVMQKAMAVVQKADPEFKVSLAGDYHRELADGLYDYCITFGQNFPADVKAARDARGQVSTLYTCCTEAWPNTFTFSAPAEATWIGFYIAKQNLNGYLRWAYNSWPADPMNDSRFRSWAAGDTYLVYPGNLTSIRFERLIEGIQNWEKIQILKQEGKSKQIDRMLQLFDLTQLPEVPASQMVNQAEKILNGL